MQQSVQCRLYSLFVLVLQHYEWSAALIPACLRHVPRSCFCSNAVLVVSQWQDRAWTVPLHPPINAENEAGQAASTVFLNLRYDRNQPYRFGSACSTNCSIWQCRKLQESARMWQNKSSFHGYARWETVYSLFEYTFLAPKSHGFKDIDYFIFDRSKLSK